MWEKSISRASSSRSATGRTASGGAHQHGERRHRLRLEPGLAQALQREMAETLRQPLAARGDQQAVVGEDRHARAQSLEDLDLHRRVGDVVLAPDHVGDPEVDIVDHGRQRVEIGAVLAHQHRIGERAAIHMAMAAHEVLPGDVR